MRYFNVFGPRQDPDGNYAAVIPKFISRMLDGDRPVIYDDGDQSRDFVFIDDVVQANMLAAESNISGEAFNVGSGSQVTVNELVSTLNDLLDTDIDPVYDDPRPGDVRYSYADISKAKRLLDYDPRVTFTEGLQKTIRYYQ